MGYKDPEARRAYQRENWRKYFKPKSRTEVLKVRRNNLQKWFSEYKETLSCIKCGESHPACLDFHHRDPTEKTDVIQRLICSGYSQKRVLEEIDKCDVLCANCHRKHHWDERKASEKVAVD